MKGSCFWHPHCIHVSKYGHLCVINTMPTLPWKLLLLDRIPSVPHSKHQKWPNQTGIKQKWQQNGHFRTKQSLTCWMKDKCEWTRPNAIIVSRDSPRSCDSIQIRASMSLWHAPNASVSGSIWQKRASGSNPVCRTSKTPKVTTSNRNGYRIAVNSCMFLFTLSLPLFPLSFFPFLSLSLSPQFFFPPPG